MPSAGVSPVPNYSSTRGIGHCCLFPGLQTRRRPAWRRARIASCCGFPVRGVFRGARGLGITVFTLLSRRMDRRMDSLDVRFTPRIDALRQALFGHKDRAA